LYTIIKYLWIISKYKFQKKIATFCTDYRRLKPPTLAPTTARKKKTKQKKDTIETKANPTKKHQTPNCTHYNPNCPIP